MRRGGAARSAGLRLTLAPRQVVEAHRDPVAHRLRQGEQDVERNCRNRRIAGAAAPAASSRRRAPLPRRSQHSTREPRAERLRARAPDCRRTAGAATRHPRRGDSPHRGPSSSRSGSPSHAGINVAPHRAIADFQPRDHHRPRPVPPRLQERQQGEQSRRCSQAFDRRHGLGQKSTHTAANVIARADPGSFIEDRTCPRRPLPT